MREFDKITSEVLTLPAENRAQLAEILIQSLDEADDLEIKSAWLKEIQAREQEIKDGTAVCKPADQVLKEAREQLRCLK